MKYFWYYDVGFFFEVQSFNYQCTLGYCLPAYGESIHGSTEDVAEACTKDHPRCKAYQYSAKAGYGLLCLSAMNEGIDGDFKNCVKSQG